MGASKKSQHACQAPALPSWQLPSRHSGSLSMQDFRDNHRGIVIVPCSNRDTAGILSIHMCACVCVHWGSGTFPSNARKRSSKTIFSEKHVHILGIWKPTKINITSLNPPSNKWILYRTAKSAIKMR